MMNKKLFALLFLALVFTQNLTFAQGDNDNQEQNQAEFNPEEGVNDEVQQQQMARQMIVICIVMSKHQLNSYGNDITQIISKESGSQSQQALYRKILAQHIQSCAQSIQPQSAGQIIQELQEKTFNVANYGQYFSTITLEQYSLPDFDKQLNPEEIQLLKMNDEMEQYWKEQQEIQEEEEEVNNRQSNRPEDYEPKFFGIASKDLPSGFKAFYFVIVFGIVGFLIYIGYTKTNENEHASPRRKKNKQTKQE